MNKFAARATPPPLQRLRKRLPTPQISCKTWFTQISDGTKSLQNEQNVRVRYVIILRITYEYALVWMTYRNVCPWRIESFSRTSWPSGRVNYLLPAFREGISPDSLPFLILCTFSRANVFIACTGIYSPFEWDTTLLYRDLSHLFVIWEYGQPI